MTYTHTYRAPDVDDRLPAHFLNYSGRVTIDPLKAMGPNTMGESLWPVTAEYDAETDKTRVGLTYIAPMPYTLTEAAS